MFTGIIEEIGVVKNLKKTSDGMTLFIDGKKVTSDITLGASIAISGVCTTVISYKDGIFSVDIMEESLDRSNLKYLSVGDRVNLERALSVNGRLDGHIVSGHVDGMGKIIKVEKRGFSHEITIALSSDLLKYVVEKGSIAIDGTSLTVVDVSDEDFKVDVIPHSGENTTLLKKSIGSYVNIEVDILAKYVEKIFSRSKEEKKSNITLDFLRSNGF